MEISKYIRDLLQESSVEKIMSKLKKELFDSFEALKELRDKAKLGILSLADFQERKAELEKKIDDFSSRILYLKKAREQVPLVEEKVQKEAELLMNEYQVEKIVMLMINAIGMVEKRLEVVEEDMNLIKSFLLTKPIPVQGHTQAPTQIPPSLQSQAIPSPPPAQPRLQASPAQPPPRAASPHPIPQSAPDSGPSEDDIAAFRSKLLRPPPKDEEEPAPASEPKPAPLSIRAALLQEMKEYFGSAKEKVEKEKKVSG